MCQLLDLFKVYRKLSHIAAYNTLCNLRLSLQKKMEELPLGVIQNLGTGKLKRILVDEVESLELLLAHAIPEGLGNTLIPIVVYVIMFFVDWKLALLTLAVLPLGLLAMGMMMQQGYGKVEQYYNSATVMNNTIIEYINGMEVVKVFNKEGESYQKYQKDVTSYRDFTLAGYKACWPWMSIYTVIFACVSALTIPFGAMFVVKGISTLPNLILILCLSFSVGDPLLKALHFVPSLTQIQRKVQELEKTLDHPPLRYSHDTFRGKGYTVDYENVTFAYEDENVINQASLSVKQGCKTALMGESGSGKSTLANLIARFWDIDAGHVYLRGTDIRELSLSELMNQISMVFQKVYLFQDTVYNNISMGKPGASKEEVWEAAKKARCYDFIMNLPNGFDTVVGEGGASLSGGEKQRISIARCILKDTPIVILDEATASVDLDNERYIQEAISELVKGKTLLVIAHRLNTIQKADQILVVSAGEIVQRGTHAQLMKQEGTYRKFVELRC